MMTSKGRLFKMIKRQSKRTNVFKWFPIMIVIIRVIRAVIKIFTKCIF